MKVLYELMCCIMYCGDRGSYKNKLEYQKWCFAFFLLLKLLNENKIKNLEI